MIEITTVETCSLGSRSYIADDGTTAVVVDPPRDIDRVLDVIRRRQVSVSHVLETHIHNDYVSGGLHLARLTGAAYVVAAAEPVGFPGERLGVADGDLLRSGSMTVRVLHTPGHTPNHLAYALHDASGRAVALFTGDSLMAGAAGRTDLLGDAHASSRAQWHSIRRLVSEYDEDVEVLPAHGAGSPCSAAPSRARSSSTIGHERRTNATLALAERAFVDVETGRTTEIPPYWARVAAINTRGPEPIDLDPPPPLQAGDVARRVRTGEWVVDLRPRHAFAAAHLAGTINVEHSDAFAQLVATTMPWDTPISLVSDDRAAMTDAQRQLARVGIDRPAAERVTDVSGQDARERISSFRRASFADLAGVATDVAVLDVRDRDEWQAGHLAAARNVPVAELLDVLARDTGDAIPPTGAVWVHCAGGRRASLAASLLARAGRTPILIDEPFARANEAGFALVTP